MEQLERPRRSCPLELRLHGEQVQRRPPTEHHSRTDPQGAPRRSVDHSGRGAPSTCASNATVAHATKGTTTDFSKKSNPATVTRMAEIAYLRRPVRHSSSASPATQASAICRGSALSAAAHHANAGTVNGVNKYSTRGISTAGRSPRILRNNRKTA